MIHYQLRKSLMSVEERRRDWEGGRGGGAMPAMPMGLGTPIPPELEAAMAPMPIGREEGVSRLSNADRSGGVGFWLEDMLWPKGRAWPMDMV